MLISLLGREIEKRANAALFYSQFLFGVEDKDIKGSEGELAPDLSGVGTETSPKPTCKLSAMQ